MTVKTKNRLAQETNGEQNPKVEKLTVSPPNLKILELTIRGTTPLVQNRFSAKAMEAIKNKQEAGSQAKKGQKREPKNFQECYNQARHISTEGWDGIPAGALRTAAVNACRLIGFKMILAKKAIFVEADGFDRVDSMPLVKITKGEPQYFEQALRPQTGGMDIRPRPKWNPGWEAVLRVKFDADIFSASEVANLISRVGQQIGIGEGRHDSRESCGVGWGCFEIVS